MRLWKLTLSYDGSSFYGWQVQPDLPTVQGTLASAVHRITGEAVLPQGSGRTDAGVHALGQVASFSLRCSIPAANLHRALNQLLPSSIRIVSAEIVDPPFHARHSVLRKSYEYRIFPAALNPADEAASRDPSASPMLHRHALRICSPMLAPYVWDYPLPLDLPTLNRAAAHILGRHDFTSFAANGPDPSGEVRSEGLPGYPSTAPTPCRVIYASSWGWVRDLLVYRVTGSGFLHHMVRNLVGTFVHAGAGRAPADAVPAILDARSRSAAGATAPARGLFLVNVEYS